VSAGGRCVGLGRLIRGIFCGPLRGMRVSGISWDALWADEGER
jgi:hypothetical protein